MAEKNKTVTFRYIEMDEDEPKREAAQLVKDILPAVIDRSQKQADDAS
jgi:hypothetical protein